MIALRVPHGAFVTWCVQSDAPSFGVGIVEGQIERLASTLLVSTETDRNKLPLGTSSLSSRFYQVKKFLDVDLLLKSRSYSFIFIFFIIFLVF